MRYGIFSDVHSNLEALDAVVIAYKKEGIDKYLCSGDVVGYAADPNECIDIVKSLAMVTVAGNHDWASVHLFSLDYFNPLAKEAVYWTRQNLNNAGRYFLGSLNPIYQDENLTLVHGTLDNPQDFNYMTDGYVAEKTFGLLENNLCFLGHTHVVGIFRKDMDGRLRYCEDDFCSMKPENKYIVNVGSIGQPRDRNPKAAYCIYDTEKKEVWIKRADYDILTARRKILEQGLPNFFGDRLLTGR